ncbi:hotdog fold thioesterase [Citricoccus muralis]|uniref:Hotdog fold thioesterase n=1 Tax=Citricoccus muralis TaxID=169134 RepID=A0ABY8H742_9MICC|nr:hotdog fold thioesterase [Citricoccus muralis]WFP16970.1 hotdog fold thioesterase [Citricoccus muralis]
MTDAALNAVHPELPAGIDPDSVVRGSFGAHDHPTLGVDAAAEWLGYEVSEYADGYARAHMVLRDEMLNGFKIAHGGMIFAFGDTCFAWSCNDPRGDGSTITVASGVDINFISSPVAGTRLTAVGVRRSTTGRSGIYDITITDDEGGLVAEFRGRSRTIPNKRRA